MSYYNPFQNYELRIPNNYREQIDRFTQTQPEGGQKPAPEDSPFSRQIDFWFLSFCLGIHEGRTSEANKWHKFITGEILSRNPERIQLIELAIIGHKKDPWIIDKPGEIISMANGFAATGIPILIEMLEDEFDKPIWNVTDQLINRYIK